MILLQSEVEQVSNNLGYVTQSVERHAGGKNNLEVYQSAVVDH